MVGSQWPASHLRSRPPSRLTGQMWSKVAGPRKQKHTHACCLKTYVHENTPNLNFSVMWTRCGCSWTCATAAAVHNALWASVSTTNQNQTSTDEITAEKPRSSIWPKPHDAARQLQNEEHKLSPITGRDLTEEELFCSICCIKKIRIYFCFSEVLHQLPILSRHDSNTTFATTMKL